MEKTERTFTVLHSCPLKILYEETNWRLISSPSFSSVCAQQRWPPATCRSSSILHSSPFLYPNTQSFVTISNHPQVAHLIAPPSRDSVPPLKRVEGRGRKKKGRQKKQGGKRDDGKGDKEEQMMMIKASVFLWMDSSQRFGIIWLIFT